MSQKKGKKKGRKKDDDDWEDEVANEVEQMKLSEKNDLQVQNETDDHEEAEKTKKKKKKGKKGKGSMDSDNEDDDEVSGKDKGSKSSFGLLDVEDVEEKDEVVNKQIKTKQTKEDNRTKTEKLSNKNQEAVFDDKNNESVKNLGTGNEKEVTEINCDNEYEFDVKKEKRKAKKTKAKTEEEDIELNLEEESTVKTAAQKRAEKKEREKKKKDAQKKKAKDTKASKNETEKADDHSGEGFEGTGGEEKKEKPVNEDENAVAVNQVAEEGAGGEFGPVDNEKEDHEEGDEKKKKKKKKKKAKEDEPPKTKKPGKAMIKQIQEAREKARLEEERLRQEEEAKQRAFEEAEKKRLEKIRLEQERKDKQKQKEKKRKEKLKKEGKLLTKAQKQQKAQAEAMLQAMRETGISIPSRSNAESSEVKKPVRYGKKRTKQGPEKSDTADTEQNETAEDATATTSLDVQEFKEEDVKEENAQKSESDDDDVNDTWDADEDDEESVTEDSVTKKEKDSKEIDEEEKEEEGDETSEEDEEEENEEDDASEEDEDALEDGTESDSKESDEDDSLSKEERDFARAKARITKRREKAEAKRSKEKLRSPVICVMGHVDTGKTKILDKIRHSHVQDGEAGGITQQIGATNVPSDAVRTQTRMIKDFSEFEMKMPGLLIIDTPGHESFSNLRSRGSTLCDMAILVVDIMHGLEPQTIESINLLRTKKTPFVVALNKVDRLFEWKRGPNSSIVDTLKKQNRNTKQEFEERLNQIVGEFANEGLNAALFHKNVDEKSYISLVPTSAHTGDGMGDLIALIVKLCQTKLAHRLAFSEELQCTVLEVKAITGLGTTVDVILTNGRLAESQTIVLGGIEGAIVTQVRTLLMPQPLKELRVKNQYATFKEIEAAQGVKITGKELDKALAGSPLFVAYQEDEIEVLKKEVSEIVQQSLKSIKVSERGVCVQASTLGSLEALLEFLKTSKIPYCSVSVGPVHKRDVMKASVMLEHDNLFAVILAFDVKVERDAQELADNLGVKIFTADIIYHLFDRFTNYREELKQKKRDEFKHIAIFPCKLRILSEHIYNSRDPIVVGVAVEAGIVKEGTPICVPSKEFVDVGIVTGIEANHKALEKATKGMEVCVKIEPVPGEAPKLYGRHFDYTDLLISKISRESIDACKNYFRDDLQKSDWQLMIELKKLFKII